MAFLREQHIKDLGQIRYAFLEQTGHLGLIQYDEKDQLEHYSTFPQSYED
jgi:uncharacterized membrane protein YcaP (DUF421 family)